jgi:flagella synthesis protein FlgN
MSAVEHLKAIVQAIREDIACCGELVPLLTEQQRLLARHDGEALDPVGAQITSRLQVLEGHGQERVQRLRALGLEPNQQGIQTLITKLPASVSEQLREAWHQLEMGLARCKALNERNGELLASQRMALAEIKGEACSDYGV